MPKTPGAPQGNLNALKHGLYSRKMRKPDCEDLASNANSLEQEKILLRRMIRRTMQLSYGVEDAKEAARLLEAVSAAITRLANLLKIDSALHGNRSPVIDEISAAIRQINQEIRSKR